MTPTLLIPMESLDERSKTQPVPDWSCFERGI